MSRAMRPKPITRQKARREFAKLKKAVGAMIFQTDVATGKHLKLLKR